MGSKVALSWAPNCGQCYFCDSGLSHLCQATAPIVLDGVLPSGTSRLSDLSHQPIAHYSFLSTWAEYAVVDAASCIEIDDDMDLIPASLIGCAVMTGVGAAINTARIKPGSYVAVIGLDGVGLNTIQGARICGAEKIIGINTNPDKKSLAEKFGMTHFINASEEDVLSVVKTLTV